MNIISTTVFSATGAPSSMPLSTFRCSLRATSTLKSGVTLTPYLEIAKTGRAGCKNKECKDNGVKIGVGELRYGVLVEIPNTGHTSWSWKHW